MPDKYCGYCGKELLKRDNEKRVAFSNRRFCGIPCAMKMPRSSRSDVWTRFWKYVDKQGDCWLWTGGKDRYGRGMFKIGGRGGKRVIAPRLSFFFYHGYMPANALHKCDNPSCVRIEHLFNGSIKDNTADMISKGRAAWQKQIA